MFACLGIGSESGGGGGGEWGECVRERKNKQNKYTDRERKE